MIHISTLIKVVGYAEGLFINPRRVGGPEGYCSVCACMNKVFWITNNIGTSIELPRDVKLYKDQNKRQTFSKTYDKSIY